MTGIITALASGISEKKIIEFLMRKFPQLAPRIQQAIEAGMSPKKILDFFSKDQSFEKLQEMNREYSTNFYGNPLVQAEKIRSQNIAQDPTSHLQRKVQQGLETAGKYGAGALGAYVLSRALPSALQQLAPGLLQQPVGAQAAPAQAPQQQIPAQIAQQSQEQPVIEPSKSALHADLIKEMGFADRIQNMAKAMSIPDIVGVLEQYLMSPAQKKWLKEKTKEPLENIVKDFISSNPVVTKEEKKPEETPIPSPVSKVAEPEIPKMGKSEIPSEQKKTVALPSGDIGTIESEKNGIAKILVDGKEKHRKLDEVIQSPLPQKDLADLYNDVIAGIERESGTEVSRNVYWAGYDPKTNELIYIPHGGRAYIYDNISEEDKNSLTDVLTQRKSTGQNYIGAWAKGSKSPIGAAMYQLIQKLQKERGGKGNEYKNRFETIYDALELAKEHARKKHAEKKKAKKPRAR